MIIRGRINLNHIFLLLFPAACFASPVFTGYKITLKTNLREQKVYLWYNYGENQYPLDTSGTDMNGEAVFSKDYPLTGGVYIIRFTKRKSLEILLTAENQFTVTVDTSDLVGKTTFIGSRENSLYYDFLKKVTFNAFQSDYLEQKLKKGRLSPDSVNLVKKMIGLYARQDEQIRTGIIKKYPETFLSTLLKAGSLPEIPGNIAPARQRAWMKRHYFDHVDFGDERLAFSPVFFKLYKQYINTFGFPDTDSIVACVDTILKKAALGKENFKWSLYFLSSSFERSAVPGQDVVFVHLVDEYYKKDRCWWLTPEQMNSMYKRAEVLRHLFIGKPCPDFTALDSSGKDVNLYSKITRLTVLYFWSYDCKHCLEETPRLAEWIKKHPEINLVTACATPDEEKWKEKLKEFKLPGTHVIDPEMKANYVYTFSISTTPQLFVVGKNKKILAKYLDDTKALDAFLKQKK